MIGLIMKLIVCPVILLLSNYILGLQYTLAQSLYVGFIIAIVGHMMEVLILKSGTLWISTISDFIVAFAIIYLSQFLLRNVAVTLLGALLIALILTVVEYFEHLFLIRAGKTKKGD